MIKDVRKKLEEIPRKSHPKILKIKIGEFPVNRVAAGVLKYETGHASDIDGNTR